MALNNPWVTYIDRSYKSIKASLINRLKVAVPEITDYSDSNLLVIIIALFAGLVEQLNYYIDQIARESFITTARKYTSMIKLTRLIDYRVKAYIPASVDLKVTMVDSSGNPVLLESDFEITQGVIVKNSSGVEYLLVSPVTVFTGTSYAYVRAKQRKTLSNQNLGTTNNAPSQTFVINDKYEHDSVGIVIDNEAWQLKTTFAFSGPLDKHFIVEVNEDKEIFVKFGDGVHGVIPSAGNQVLATYYQTLGEAGNSDVNTITNFDASTKPDVTGYSDDITITNPQPASGGLSTEGLERIRSSAPLSIRTLGRAVTLQDYKDLSKLVPGVSKVDLEFNCAQALQIYVAPTSGTEASSALLTDVEDFFADKKMFGLAIFARPAGITELIIGLTVTAKFRRNVIATSNDIKEALLIGYGFNNSDINRRIRKSDIIALIDNLDKVDFLSLDYIYTKPYPRRGIDTDTQLTWTSTVNSGSTVKALWRLVAITTNTFRVYRNDEYVGVASSGSLFSSNGLSFTISGNYTVNEEWFFSTYAFNSDIIVDDFTVPIIKSTGINLEVIEQYI